jgi:low affinity Fe/Cu permease
VAAIGADRLPRGARIVMVTKNSTALPARAARPHDDAYNRSWSHLFSRMANATSSFAGKPQAFLIATLVVVIWAASGPLFNYSDTWQLVINTSTTIVTFLMVFLIQHTQNRDTLALQLKLAELIIAMRGAQNRVATIEDMEEGELEQLHQEYRRRADETLEHLQGRRKASKQEK